MKLSVVIVNYNVRQLLEACLKSVEKALEGIEGDIYVVDNNSSDGSVAYIRERFPHGFSKYCIGSALTNEALRRNRIKPRLHSVEKIMNKEIKI